MALGAGWSAGAEAGPRTYDIDSLLFEAPAIEAPRPLPPPAYPPPPAYLPPPAPRPAPRPAPVRQPAVAPQPIFAAQPAPAAQPRAPARPGPKTVPGKRFGYEIDARTWFSSGHTDWNHNASDGVFANPTSDLDYDDLDTLIAEVDVTVTLFEDFFVRGNYGQDVIDLGDGALTDSDFLAADMGAPSLRSRSDMPGLDVWYTTWDAGWTYYRTPDTTLRVFLGYQHWEEEYTAEGVTVVGCSDFFGTSELGPCPDLGENVAPGMTAVTNKVEWDSLRLGLTADVQFTKRISVTGELAWIPFTDMHNEDSHHLRVGSASDGCLPAAPLAVETPDLASAPNIIMDGDGSGWQGDIEIVYRLARNWAAFLGFRYWILDGDGDVTFECGDGSSATFPLNDFDSERFGITAGITYSGGI